MTDVIEYIHRSTLNMTNLNTVHKIRFRPRLYHVVEVDFDSTITSKEEISFLYTFALGNTIIV